MPAPPPRLPAPTAPAAHFSPRSTPDAGTGRGPATLGELAPGIPEALHPVPLRVAAVLAVVLGVVGGAVWLLGRAPGPVEDTLPYATPSSAAEGPAVAAASSTTAAPSEVVVHAAGAVVAPGLYRLTAPARVDDVVRAAGGLAADADGDRLNLAAPVADGARVFVPRVGGDVPAVSDPQGPSPAGGGGGGAGGGGAGAGGLVDLNTASEDELDTLPGVGPATASAIVAHREAHGPFRSVDGLLDVRGIGEAKLDGIRDLVTVG